MSTEYLIITLIVVIIILLLLKKSPMKIVPVYIIKTIQVPTESETEIDPVITDKTNVLLSGGQNNWFPNYFIPAYDTTPVWYPVDGISVYRGYYTGNDYYGYHPYTDIY